MTSVSNTTKHDTRHFHPNLPDSLGAYTRTFPRLVDLIYISINPPRQLACCTLSVPRALRFGYAYIVISSLVAFDSQINKQPARIFAGQARNLSIHEYQSMELLNAVSVP